jgi:hypothetical protein
MKIYCKNCKYLSKNCFGSKICMADGFKNVYGQNVGERICEERNKNFDCRYYKKLWYKFWVKDNR